MTAPERSGGVGIGLNPLLDARRPNARTIEATPKPSAAMADWLEQMAARHERIAAADPADDEAEYRIRRAARFRRRAALYRLGELELLPFISSNAG